MRTLLSLLTLWLALATLSLAVDLEAIRTGAEASAKSLQSGDYAGVLDRTYPKVIEQGGGREKLLAGAKEAMEGMKKEGFQIKSATISKPGAPVTAGDQVFSVVPLVLKLQTPKSTVTTNGYLLAVSDDRGATWSYIDGSALTPQFIQQLFPNFPASLKLPEKKEPTVQKRK